MGSCLPTRQLPFSYHADPSIRVEEKTMKPLLAIVGVSCVIAGLGFRTPARADDEKTKAAKTEIRVGAFDSRLVAIAYVRSEAFKKRLAKLRAELGEAKAAGDKKRIKQLEALGPALQELVHKQGFSTWPVHDILKTIKEELPGIAKQADVDIIVSKWDVAFRRDGAAVIDVTDLMVKPFSPDEATRKVLESVRKKAPVPLDQLKKH